MVNKVSYFEVLKREFKKISKFIFKPQNMFFETLMMLGFVFLFIYQRENSLSMELVFITNGGVIITMLILTGEIAESIKNKLDELNNNVKSGNKSIIAELETIASKQDKRMTLLEDRFTLMEKRFTLMEKRFALVEDRELSK